MWIQGPEQSSWGLRGSLPPALGLSSGIATPFGSRRNSTSPLFVLPLPPPSGDCSRFLSQPSHVLPCLTKPWWPGRCTPASSSFPGKPCLSAPVMGGFSAAWRPGGAAKPFSKPRPSVGKNLTGVRVGSGRPLACQVGRQPTEKGLGGLQRRRSL